MLELLQRIWENRLARTEGPLNLRFLIQPTISIIFAIRAGIRDAKSGTTPYLMRLAKSKKEERKTVAKEIWRDVGKIFIVGTVLDVIYQLILSFQPHVKDQFYPFESLLVAFVLAILPYMILRGPINRLISLFIKKKDRLQ